ncbi:MAG: OadG family protein [Anaerolineales bacterium]|nr:OadG family protein [Anaerolineales bacterium]
MNRNKAHGGDAMLIGVGLVIGGLILLFIAISLIGFITPRPDDRDSANSGVVHRH